MNIEIKELDRTDNYYQYCCLLKQLTAIDPDNITLEQFSKQLEIIKSNPFHKILIAKINDDIIGTTSVIIEPKFIHDCSFVAHIEDVIVDSNQRTLGLGRILIDKAIEIANEYKCYKIILDCSEKNIEFYKKFGFVPKEKQMALYL